MAQNVFSVDGKYYDVRIPQGGIKRSFEVLDGEAAKRLLSGRMKRDIIGTFYNYEIAIDTDALSKTDYDELFELLSAPVDSHMLIVPYGQETLTFEAYITGGSDTLIDQINGVNNWSGFSMKFIAMAPQRT